MNKRPPPLAVLALLLLVAAPGCAYRLDGPKFGDARSAADGWTRVAPDGAGVVCSMPGRPTFEAAVQVQDDGTPATVRTATAQLPDAQFSMVVVDFEGGLFGDTMRESERVIERITGELDLEERHSERFDAPGFYARQVTGHTRDGVFFSMRIYVGMERIYLALAATPATHGAVHAAERFMASVEIDSADALYPLVEHGASSDWAPVFMPEDDFAVTMPAISDITASSIQLGSRTAAMRTYEASSGSAQYRVRVLPFEHDHPLAFAEVADALRLGGADGVVQASGYPGEAHPHSRLIRTSSRIYVLEVVEHAAATADTSRFFNSLRIL